MKLSIITINYNNASGLKKTLDSVVAQTWYDFEHIIVDGGSTDNSVSKIQEYANTYSNRFAIRWISELDTGVYNAMNKGIRMAKGEYCLFMNGGDCFSSIDTLKSLDLSDATVDLLIGYSIEDQTGRELKYKLDRLSLLEIMQHGISHQAMFVKRKLFDKIGYYSEDLRVLADCEFLFKCVLENITFENTGKCVALVEPGGLSNTMLDQMRLEGKKIKRVLPNSISEDYQFILAQKDSFVVAKAWMRKTYGLYVFYSKINKIWNKLIKKDNGNKR